MFIRRKTFKTIKEEYEKQVLKLQQELDHEKGRAGLLEQDVLMLNREVKKLQAKLKKAEKDVRDRDNIITKLEIAINELKGENQELRLGQKALMGTNAEEEVTPKKRGRKPKNKEA